MTDRQLGPIESFVQRVEPLAIPIGAFCREYVAPHRRMDAVDALYRLIAEARALPAPVDDQLDAQRVVTNGD